MSFQDNNQKIDERLLHELLNEVDLNKNGEIEIAEFFQVRVSSLYQSLNFAVVSLSFVCHIGAFSVSSVKLNQGVRSECKSVCTT